MTGLQLCADLQGCSGPLLTDLQSLRELLTRSVQQSGLTAVAERFHAFEPAGSGITGVLLLAEQAGFAPQQARLQRVQRGALTMRSNL